MFERILIPVDGSKHGRRAVEMAIELAKCHESSVFLLHVIRDLWHQVVHIWFEIGAVHPLHMRTKYGMPEVADHRVDDEGFSMGIKIGSPGIRHTIHNFFDDAAAWVVAPDASVDLDPL